MYVHSRHPVVRTIIGAALVCATVLVFGHQATAQWIYTAKLIYKGSTNDRHYKGAAVLTPSGIVVITGGAIGSNPVTVSNESYHNDAYAFGFNWWRTLKDGRAWHSVVTLRDGRMLVIGGYNGNTLASSERNVGEGLPWERTGTRMTTSRARTTATLLRDGRVLVAGGLSIESGGVTETATCEIFDPPSGIWQPTASMSTGRSSHASVLLNSGQVLAVSGYPYSPSCDLYDPATGQWRSTASIIGNGCGEHSLTMLRDGRVLLTGGWGGTKGMFNRCEIYDPATEQWRLTAPMSTPRASHRTVLLPNGNVFVIGGHDARTAGDDNTCFSLATTEIFDPVTERWRPGPRLPNPMSYFSALLLPTGFVAILGGGKRNFTADPEKYDTATYVVDFMVGNVAPTGALARGHASATATALPDGTVLLAGGGVDCSIGAAPAGAEIYNTTSGAWTIAPGSPPPMRSHTATLLPNGRVALVGGTINATPTSAVYFREPSGAWTAGPSLIIARAEHTTTLMNNGDILVVGGRTAAGPTASAEILHRNATRWEPVAPLPIALYGHTATLAVSWDSAASRTQYGTALVAGGTSQSGPSKRCFMYVPACDAWRNQSDMATARTHHTATPLPDGRTLLVGGEDAARQPTCTAFPSIYQIRMPPATIAGPATHRRRHTATLLTNGDVLIAGGVDPVGNALATTEIFNPVGNAWRPGPSLPAPRTDHTAVLLPNGNVLIAGGSAIDASGCTTPTDCIIFDPAPDDQEAARPVITSLPPPPSPIIGSDGITFRIKGTGFTGGNGGVSTEGSTGDYNNSPSNFPIVHIRRIGAGAGGDDFMSYLPFDGGSARWSSTSTQVWLEVSEPDDRRYPAGVYAATVIANGIPSLPAYFALDYDDTIPSHTPSIVSKDVRCGYVQYTLSAPCPLTSLLLDTADSRNVSIALNTALPTKSPTVTIRLIDSTRDGHYVLRANGELIAEDLLRTNQAEATISRTACETYAVDISSECGITTIGIDSASVTNLTLSYEPPPPAKAVRVTMRLVDPTRNGRYALRVNGEQLVADTVRASRSLDLGPVGAATVDTGCGDITIRNLSVDAPLIIDGARLAHNLQFSMPPGQFPIVIPPGGSRTLQVCYAATIADAPNDTLMIGTGCDSISLPLVPLVRSLAYTGTGENCGASLDFRPATLSKPFFNAGLPTVDDGARTVAIHVDVYSPAGVERWMVRGTIYTMLGESVAEGRFVGTAAVDTGGRTLQRGSIRFDARGCVPGLYVAVLPTPDGVVSRRVRIVR